MSILSRIAEIFGYQKIKLEEEKPKELAEKGEILPWSKVPETDNLEPVLGESPPAWNAEEYLKQAKGWVYSCVSVISDEIAAMELHLYRVTAKGNEEIFEHPLLDALYKINDYTTKFDHFWLTQQYLELTGEAPWLLDRIGDEIQGIYLLRPDKLTVKYDKDKIIGGYVYEIGPNKKETYDPENVIFIKYPNPLKPLRGRGTLEAVAQTVDLDTYAEKWNLNFFYNSARPDIILSTDGVLNEQQLKRLEEQWKKKFKGVSKAFKMAILEGGLKVDRLQLSQRDMDFLNQMRFSRDKIMSIFRVPKTAIGITDDVNRANAEATDYVFAKRTIKPKMRRIVEQLNEFLVPNYGDDLFLDFTDPVPENVDLKLKNYENSLKNGWRSINEVRELEGLTPVENGDAPMLPMALVPLGEPAEGKSVYSFGKPRKQAKKKEWSEREIYIKARKKGKEYTNRVKGLVKEMIKKNMVNGEIKKLVKDYSKMLKVKKSAKDEKVFEKKKFRVKIDKVNVDLTRKELEKIKNDIKLGFEKEIRRIKKRELGELDKTRDNIFKILKEDESKKK